MGTPHSCPVSHQSPLSKHQKNIESGETERERERRNRAGREWRGDKLKQNTGLRLLAIDAPVASRERGLERCASGTNTPYIPSNVRAEVTMSNVESVKVVLLGDSGVGKSR